MKTIEERATLDADKYVGENGNFGAWQSHRLAYIRVATEEREKCIRVAQELLAEIVEDLLARYGETWNEVSKHQTLENIRKVMEGGNNGIND